MSGLTSFRFPHLAASIAAVAMVAATWSPAWSAEVSDSSGEIIVQALALLGVPYRWGGNDPANGLDCSGFVRHIFKTAAALDLPRQSEQMSRVGHRVARSDLRAGDLLFFNTHGHANSHVALYLGDGRFVHAPSRNSQVRIDWLDARYWSDRFNGARRIELGNDVTLIAARGSSKPASRDWLPSAYPQP
ncbi:MAG TPA: C40 family peptidase [Burkholderiaceae bacterium]|nr:C40 family peptidase [Burkholderiaceae bacterium]